MEQILLSAQQGQPETIHLEIISQIHSLCTLRSSTDFSRVMPDLNQVNIWLNMCSQQVTPVVAESRIWPKELGYKHRNQQCNLVLVVVWEGLGNNHLQWLKTSLVLRLTRLVQRANRGLFTSTRIYSAEKRVTCLASCLAADGACKAVLLLCCCIESHFQPLGSYLGCALVKIIGTISWCRKG